MLEDLIVDNNVLCIKSDHDLLVAAEAHRFGLNGCTNEGRVDVCAINGQTFLGLNRVFDNCTFASVRQDAEHSSFLLVGFLLSNRSLGQQIYACQRTGCNYADEHEAKHHVGE